MTDLIVTEPTDADLSAFWGGIERENKHKIACFPYLIGALGIAALEAEMYGVVSETTLKAMNAALQKARVQ